MAFLCPECGDRYTQSLRMIHSSGTYSRSQSVLSGMASPPVTKSTSGLTLILVFIVIGSIFSFVALTSPSSAPPVVQQTKVVSTMPHSGHKDKHATASTPNAAPAAVPPSPMHTSLSDIVAATAFSLVFAGAFGLFPFVALRKASRYNTTVYPRLLAQWEASFMCRACGNVFTPPHSRLTVRDVS
jgi:hypothetical protein